MSKAATRREFEERLELLQGEFYRLLSFHQNWEALRQMKKESEPVWKVAPSFFDTAEDALYRAWVSWMNKLISPTEQRGMMDFLTWVEQKRKLLFSSDRLLRNRRGIRQRVGPQTCSVPFESIREHRAQLKELAIAPSLKGRRDKFHAHFDKGYFEGRSRLDRDFPLRRTEIQEALGTLKKVLNFYSQAYNGVTEYYPQNSTDLDQLIAALERK